MLGQLRRKSIANAIKVVLIYAIAIGIFAYLMRGLLIPQFRPVKEFNELSAAELELNYRYNITVDWTYGHVVELLGSRGGPDRNIYVISTKDDEKLIMIEVYAYEGKRNFEMMLRDEEKGKTTTPFQVQAILREYRGLDKEKEYMMSYCNENGLEYDQFATYMLDTNATGGWMQKSMYILAGILALGGVLIIIHLLRAFTGGKLKALKNEMASCGLTKDQIEEDFKNAYVIDKDSQYRIGNKAIYFFNSSKPHMIILEDLVWIYEDYWADKGRTGIEGKRHYNHQIRTVQDKKYQADFSSQTKSAAAIRELMRRTPWILLGKNNAYESMKIEELKAIKYNSTEKKPFRMY